MKEAGRTGIGRHVYHCCYGYALVFRVAWISAPCQHDFFFVSQGVWFSLFWVLNRIAFILTRVPREKGAENCGNTHD